MFNLGFWEMVVLAFIALVVVGPEKLPTFARSIGRFLNDLKRTTNTIASDITSTMDEEQFLKDQKKKNDFKSFDSLKSDADSNNFDQVDDQKGLNEND